MTAQVLICVAIPLKWTEIGRWPPLILHTGGGGGGGDVSIARCSYIPAHSITYSVQLRMRDSSIVRLLLPGAEYCITNESSR